MRALLVLGMGIALAGCGFPPAVTVAGYVADGILVAGTGKTSSDHAFSMLAGEDCAVWRAFKGNLVCEDRAFVMQASDAAQVPSLGEETPQQIIGDEKHELVLDGAS